MCNCLRTESFPATIGIGNEIVCAAGPAALTEDGCIVDVANQEHTQRLHDQVAKFDFLLAYHILCKQTGPFTRDSFQKQKISKGYPCYCVRPASSPSLGWRSGADR